MQIVELYIRVNITAIGYGQEKEYDVTEKLGSYFSLYHMSLCLAVQILPWGHYSDNLVRQALNVINDAPLTEQHLIRTFHI